MEGFRPPGPSAKEDDKRRKKKNKNKNSLDYNDYDEDVDHNLIFYSGAENAAGNGAGNNGEGKPSILGSFLNAVAGDDPNSDHYTVKDVLDSVRKNETNIEIAKKALSAAAALSERSSASPVFMMWTVPTSILALLGLVYFVSAIGIIGYQLALNGGGNVLGPTLLALTIPAFVAVIFVAVRSSFDGDLNVKRVVRGDFRNGLGGDFDGVHFALDSAFGAASMLGVAWIASVAI